jgi:hypothetical protein
MSSKSGGATVSTYYVGLQYVLCAGPIDNVTQIYVGEKNAWRGVGEDQDQITLNKPELFGGNSREGGITGKVDLAFGTVAQAVNTYIQNKLRRGADTPKFIGVAQAIARHVYVGTNYYLKPWYFRASRVHVRKLGLTQWQDALAEVPVSTTLTANSIVSLTFVTTTAYLKLQNVNDLHPGMSITVAGASYASYNGTFTIVSVNYDTDVLTYTMGSEPAGNSTVVDVTVVYSFKGLINAVHIVRDCLTDPYWGFGFNENTIDETTFAAAAQTCYDEELGFGFLWENGKLSDFILDVLRHVQGSLYVNRATGKFELKLTRYIEDSTGLLELNDTNTSEVTDFNRKSLDDLINLVTVKFINNGSANDDAYPIGDGSLLQRQGAIVDKSITYAGVTCLEMAQKLAARDLQQLSLPVYSCTIKVNRDAEDLYPGSAFILNRPDIIDFPIIMRVVTMQLGTIDKGEITIEAIQDMFHAATLVYSVTESSNWSDPISEPIAVEHKIVNEMPYYLVALNKGDAFAQAVSTSSSYIAVGAVAPVSTAYSAGLYTGPADNDLTRHGKIDFCFGASLGNTLTKTSTSVTLADVTDLELLSVDKFVQIGDELVKVTAIDDVTEVLTIERGVLDTVPVAHSIGERIYGWQNFFGTDQVEYAISETTYVSLTTVTPKGELPIYDADVSITYDGRLHMPYPPGDLKLDGSYWPASHATGALTFTWAHRNRLQQTAGLINYYTTSITTEPSVTYSWELIRTDTLAVLDSGTGLTADTLTTSVLVYTGEVKFSIWSVRDGFTSFQTVEHIFDLT